MASNFMRVAEKFGNYKSTYNLNQSQMIEMLALPDGETEKFIEEKAAEGTPVEDMTVKKLRVEVAKYRADFLTERDKFQNLSSAFENQKNEIERLKKNNEGLKDTLNGTRKTLDRRIIQCNELEHQIKNQKPITVEPPDYQKLKAAHSQLQNKIISLQKKLDDKTVEVVMPADYEQTKKELAKLQAEKSALTQRMDVFQKLDIVARYIRDIIQSPSETGIDDYAREYNDRFGAMCADFQDFLRSYHSLYKEHMQ